MSNLDRKPLVSVIIPTYKRSEMLPRAIDSVLCQTYANVQIVVVDDNNPDTEWRKTTESTMKKYGEESRVKYVCHEKNKNGAAARNTGIREADGEIVCFLDDDDWFYTEKIEMQVEYLLSHPEYRAVYCGWDRAGKKVVPTRTGNLSYNILSGDNIIYTNAIMMWKENALACGGWDETFKRHQEAAFLLRYFRSGEEIGVISKSLVGIDISDRSNMAANSDINQQHVEHYLASYSDIIEACEVQRKGAKRDILSHRYRGVLLAHIKSKNYKSAARVYFNMLKKMPIKFNTDIIRYALKRVHHG
ncbi:MAG: glycosyltransferase family 2 protein [Ruminococcaceae bacterium]|nr:glycosyltransferase family 2 protein [Oscillospiraceae bacterium]